jgi:hypothetical protein
VTVSVRQQAKVVECLALIKQAYVLRATDGDVDNIAADLDAALGHASQTGALTHEPFILEEFGRLRGVPADVGEALRLYSAIGKTRHVTRLRTDLDVPTPQGG